MLVASQRTVRPFSSSSAAPRRVQLSRRATLQVRRAAEVDPALEQAAMEEFAAMQEEEDFGPRSRRRDVEKGMELKHFLPLPKPAHLVYVKPTVAVVAGLASRASVGLKMSAGDQGLERYVIEYYARSVK